MIEDGVLAFGGRRRVALQAAVLAMALLLVALLTACAGLGMRRPVEANVVGIESLPGEGMELRLAVRLRLQNPNDSAVDFDGVSLALDLRGVRFATGVSSEGGSIPRLGETVIRVPVTVSALAAARQVLGLATDQRPQVDYALRGHLSGTTLFGGADFDSQGRIDLPAGLSR
jgi:LEA14-like dessication related protein